VRRTRISKAAEQLIAAAVDAFLARGDLTASSRRSYAQTLNRLAADIGADRAVAVLDADALDGAVQGAWGACAPATWNRHVATARSFVAFCRRRGWLAADQALALVPFYAGARAADLDTHGDNGDTRRTVGVLAR